MSPHNPSFPSEINSSEHDPMRRVLLGLQFIPLLSGFMLFAPPNSQQELSRFLTDFFWWMVLLASFETLFAHISKTHQGLKKTTPHATAPSCTIYNNIKYYMVILVFAFLWLCSLQALRNSLPPLVFYPAVVLLALKGLERKLVLDGKITAAFLAALLCTTIISYISINLVVLTYVLPTTLFSLALSCMITAVAMAYTLESPKYVDDLKPRHRRLYSLLIFSGPSIIGLLAFLRILPLTYISTVVCVLPASRISASLDLKEKVALPSPPLLTRQTSGLCLFFVAMILLAGLL